MLVWVKGARAQARTRRVRWCVREVHFQPPCFLAVYRGRHHALFHEPVHIAMPRLRNCHVEPGCSRSPPPLPPPLALARHECSALAAMGRRFVIRICYTVNNTAQRGEQRGLRQGLSRVQEKPEVACTRTRATHAHPGRRHCTACQSGASTQLCATSSLCFLCNALSARACARSTGSYHKSHAPARAGQCLA